MGGQSRCPVASTTGTERSEQWITASRWRSIPPATPSAAREHDPMPRGAEENRSTVGMMMPAEPEPDSPPGEFRNRRGAGIAAIQKTAAEFRL